MAPEPKTIAMEIRVLDRNTNDFFSECQHSHIHSEN